jgi:hypothetical protein
MLSDFTALQLEAGSGPAPKKTEFTTFLHYRASYQKRVTDALVVSREQYVYGQVFRMSLPSLLFGLLSVLSPTARMVSQVLISWQ